MRFEYWHFTVVHYIKKNMVEYMLRIYISNENYLNTFGKNIKAVHFWARGGGVLKKEPPVT